MKTKITLLLLVQLLAWLAPQPVRAQGTAFTYQGRLNTTNGAANGSYDFTFAVFDTGSGGAAGSGTITNVAVAVSNGLFTTTLDFGNAPDGLPAWLEIGVRPSSSNPGAFTTLAPRQAVLPTPYAMFATTASNLVGTLPLAQLPAAVVTNGAGGVNLTGTFTGHGAGVTNVNAATLNGLGAGNFWQLGGNNVSGGQFLGSTNNQPLELRVNNQRGLRLEADGANSVNVVGGWEQNTVAAGVLGATIGGGGGNYFGTDLTNRVDASFGTVAGGGGNVIRQFSYQGVIGGGYNNTIQSIATTATIGGGSQNTIQTYAGSATISGGGNNVIQTNAYSATIGGGEQNTIRSDATHATIGGGYVNVIQANNSYSVIGGGYANEILPGSESTTIGGGRGNVVSSNATKATIGGGYVNVIQTGGSYSAIGGGFGNVIQPNSTGVSIAGGYNNTVQSNATTATIAGGGINTIGSYAFSSAIGGGSYNAIQSNSYYATVSGGENNLVAINAHHATIGGGQQNTILNSANSSVLGGGYHNTIEAFANSSVLAGGYNNAVRQSANLSFLGGGLGNYIGNLAYSSTLVGGFTNRIDTAAAYCFLGGGRNNSIEPSAVGLLLGQTNPPAYSAIVGGENNTIAASFEFLDGISPASHSVLVGGLSNTVTGSRSFLGGGMGNYLNRAYVSFIGGGSENSASGQGVFLGGGRNNTVNGESSFLGGGRENFINADSGFIGGGFNNTNYGQFSVIPGGYQNLTAGQYSFAAGCEAKALHQGTFVWADAPGTGAAFASTAPNQFLIRATNGVGINKNHPDSALDVNGTITCIALNQTSDRHAKENFVAVSAAEILAKVAALPITRWNFKQEAGTPHIGPMAQDFHAAFGTGTDDRHIATVDADGVALAAIQGLNQKLEEQTAAARRKDAEITELKTRLEKLEQLMNLKAGAAR